jgi:hypothetical protein
MDGVTNGANDSLCGPKVYMCVRILNHSVRTEADGTRDALYEGLEVVDVKDFREHTAKKMIVSKEHVEIFELKFVMRKSPNRTGKR